MARSNRQDFRRIDRTHLQGRDRWARSNMAIGRWTTGGGGGPSFKSASRGQ